MNYKFSKAADAKTRKGLKHQFGADPAGGVSRPYVFAKRVKAQMDRREVGEKAAASLAKQKARRSKIAAMRAGY